MKAEVNPAVPASVVGMTMPMKPATNEEVRSKFLNMIGIESKLPVAPPPSNNPVPAGTCGAANAGAGEGGGPSIVDTHWQHPRTQRVACFTESLKYDRAADVRYSPKRRKTEENPTPPPTSHTALSPDNVAQPAKARLPKKKRLNFNETVEVVPIPMRNEYSNRVKNRIWSTASEIYQNAARNTIEFAAEGWNWRTVTEDERMYVCVATGELIHPCHYEGQFQASASS